MVSMTTGLCLMLPGPKSYTPTPINSELMSVWAIPGQMSHHLGRTLHHTAHLRLSIASLVTWLFSLVQLLVHPAPLLQVTRFLPCHRATGLLPTTEFLRRAKMVYLSASTSPLMVSFVLLPITV